MEFLIDNQANPDVNYSNSISQLKQLKDKLTSTYIENHITDDDIFKKYITGLLNGQNDDDLFFGSDDNSVVDIDDNSVVDIDDNSVVDSDDNSVVDSDEID